MLAHYWGYQAVSCSIYYPHLLIIYIYLLHVSIVYGGCVGSTHKKHIHLFDVQTALRSAFCVNNAVIYTTEDALQHSVGSDCSNVRIMAIFR